MSAQPQRVVVQMANGDEVPVSSEEFGEELQDEEQQMESKQVAEEMDTDYSSSAPIEGPDSGGEVDEMIMESSQRQSTYTTVVPHARAPRNAVNSQQIPGTRFASRQGQSTGGPVLPTSPSPPPSSLTPPGHHLIAVQGPGVGQVIHHHQVPGTSTMRRIAPAPTPTTVVLAPAGTMISVPAANPGTAGSSRSQQGVGASSVQTATLFVTEAGGGLNAQLNRPAVVMTAPGGSQGHSQQGGSPGADHCYGLPYQDHNYGGGGTQVPVAQSTNSQPIASSSPSNGNPVTQWPSPAQRSPAVFAMRGRRVVPAAGAQQGVARKRNLTSGSDGEPVENFPVMGDLESYLEGESPMPETLPAPSSQNGNVVARTLGDGIAITTFRQQGEQSSNGKLVSQQPHQATYYQRYVTPAEANQMSGGRVPPARRPQAEYSSHLVQIGGRTYIRQSAAPQPPSGRPMMMGNGGRDGGPAGVMGNSPPSAVIIQPMVQRGRIYQRRPGRPTRIARTSGDRQGFLVAPSPAVSHSVHYVEGAAPVIAPSRGGRPPGRSRAGVRRMGAAAGPPTITLPNLDVSPIVGGNNGLSPADRIEKEANGLREDYQKRYDELLNRGTGTVAVVEPTAQSVSQPPIGVQQLSQPGSNIVRTSTPRGARVPWPLAPRGRRPPPNLPPGSAGTTRSPMRVPLTAGVTIGPPSAQDQTVTLTPQAGLISAQGFRGRGRGRGARQEAVRSPVRVEQLAHHFGATQAPIGSSFGSPTPMQDLSGQSLGSGSLPGLSSSVPPVGRSPRRRTDSLSPFGAPLGGVAGGIPSSAVEQTPPVAVEYINSSITLPKISEESELAAIRGLGGLSEDRKMMSGDQDQRMHSFGPLAVGSFIGASGDNNELDTESDLSETDEDSASESSSSTETDLEGEWAGTDYVTRCVCGMQDNDEFMIECDKCSVWQHCYCMGLDTKKIPDTYLCEQCNPRPLKRTTEQAKEYQEKKLKKIAREREKRRQAKIKRREQKQKEREKRRAERLKAKLSGKATEKTVKPPKVSGENYASIAENDYTDDARRFVQLQGDTLGHSLLEQISDSICQAMYVGPQIMGLVTSHTVPPNQPVAEYRGRICLKSECNGKDKLGRVIPYCLMYSGFPVNQVDVSGQDTICVDARLKGSHARFVRRSCRPNTQVKHVIKENSIHLLLVSQEFIERFNEITVPFDYDFRSSRYPIDCACANQPGVTPGSPIKLDGGLSPNGNGDEEILCPIREHNRDLLLKKQDNKKKRAEERREKKKKSVVENNLKKKVTEAAAAKKKRVNKLESKGKKKVGPPATSGKGAKKVKKPAWKVKLAGKAKKKAVASGKPKLKIKPKLTKKTKTKAAPQKKKNETTASPAKSVKKEEVETKPNTTTTPVSTRKGRKRQVKEKMIKAESPPCPPMREPEERKKSRRSTKESLPETPVKEKKSVQDLISPKTEKEEEKVEPMDYTLPEERNRVSREDKKLQSLLTQIQKMEDKERSKKETHVSAKKGKGKKADVGAKVTRSKATLGSKGAKDQKQAPKGVRGRRRKSGGKWKKGQDKSAKKKKTEKKKKKAPPPKNEKKEKSDSDTTSDDHNSDSDTDGPPPGQGGAGGSQDGSPPTSGGPAPGHGSSGRPNTRSQPPRKRWSSSASRGDQLSQESKEEEPKREEETPETGDKGGRSSGSPAKPAAAGKKRWLKQAIAEEDNLKDEQEESVPPLKKSRIANSEDPGVGIATRSSRRESMTTAEAAELLTKFPELISNAEDSGGQNATGPASPEPLAPMEGVQGPEGGAGGDGGPKIIPSEPLWGQEGGQIGVLNLDPAYMQQLTVSSGQPNEEHMQTGLDLVSGLTPPQPVPEPIKRRKVTLDEYKKRKVASQDSRDESVPSTASPSQVGERGPNWGQTAAAPASGQSFIPSMNEKELLTETASRIRLSSLPDPSAIGKGTATFEDLKAKIYGRKFLSQEMRSSAEQSGVPPPPPAKPRPLDTLPESKPAMPETRISLEDRLREQFGIEPETKDTGTLDQPVSDILYGPPMLGPPGTYGAAQGQGALWAGQNGRMESSNSIRRPGLCRSPHSNGGIAGEEGMEDGEVMEERRYQMNERPRRPKGGYSEGTRYPLKNRIE